MDTKLFAWKFQATQIYSSATMRCFPASYVYQEMCLNQHLAAAVGPFSTVDITVFSPLFKKQILYIYIQIDRYLSAFRTPLASKAFTQKPLVFSLSCFPAPKDGINLPVDIGRSPLCFHRVSMLKVQKTIPTPTKTTNQGILIWPNDTWKRSNVGAIGHFGPVKTEISKVTGDRSLARRIS